ncbi:MAG: ATP-binding protein [Desulfobacterales bacterium]|nr:ATP-binding protein [Desulfobacterales bacterium]
MLVIDEAQRLTPALLEQIRVLSNVETAGPESGQLHFRRPDTNSWTCSSQTGR